MIIFDGKQFALEKERGLQERLAKAETRRPHIGCLVFSEDLGGIVYSREKKTVAERLGISFDVVQLSMLDDIGKLVEYIEAWNSSDEITGIIVQKPWKQTWENTVPSAHRTTFAFQDWWKRITLVISRQKDVDGLHPDTIQSIKVGKWQQEKFVLPATCRAVITILEYAEQTLHQDLHNQPTLIIGRSELLGIPLHAQLQNQGWAQVRLVGKSQFQELAKSPSKLTEFKTIVTSTGVTQLISGELLGDHCVLIDAGFPQGDLNFNSVSPKTDFITPVPNGVGPVTVISLLENAVDLCYNSRS